jgi:putative ABC transport system permease protein
VNVESELESKYALLVGVYFEEEKKIKSWWEVFGEYPSVENEVLIGSDVAEVLKISTGSEINIHENNYFVSGVIKTTGSQDDNIIFGDFTNFSSLLKKINDVTMVEVSALCSDCPIDTIIEQIKEILPEADIKSIGQVMKQKMETTKQFEKFAITITIVIVLIISALVFTSMMGSVSSKKQEIGIFRAIGFTKSNIIFIILSEAIIISFIAGIIGSFAGMGISYFALPQLTDISIIEFNPLFILISTVSVILLCLIATLYPAYSAAEMDPVTAINSL